MLDPKEYELHHTTVLEDLGRKHVALVLDRKSRIIMSDGKKILEKALKLKSHGFKKVSLKTNAPVCSKTSRFLEDESIQMIKL